MRNRLYARRSRRDESGAVAPVVAISLVLVMLAAAFAVDLGMQRVLRRDLQALADVVALDLSRQIPGRTVPELDVLKASVMAASLARNQDTLGDGDESGDEPTLTARFGEVSIGANGATVFTPMTTGNPTAVQVTATNDIPYAFVPGDGAATRTAVATVEGGACFGIGSYAASLNAGDSPLLGDLLEELGADVDLDALDYEALLDTDIDVLDLLGVDIGVGTLGELIAGDQAVSLGEFYAASAEVLSNDSENAAAVAVLEALSLGVGDAEIPVADLISLGTSGSNGLDATLNALDLVTAAAAVASGEEAVTVPQAAVNLGPIANVKNDLHVIQGPQFGCGRKNEAGARAQNSQVRLDLSSSLADVSVPELLRTRVALSGSIEVASAEGQLTDVRCDPPGVTVRVSDGLVKVNLTLQVTVYASVLGIEIPVVGGPITITGQSSSSGDAVINIDADDDYDTPARVTNSSSGLPHLTTDTSGVKLLGLPAGVALGPILNALTGGLVNPLIDGLDDALLTPLLRQLGMDISGADVFLRRYAKCDASTLRG